MVDQRQQVVEEAKRIYCPPNGNMVFEKSGRHIRPKPGYHQCEASEEYRFYNEYWDIWVPAPEQDLMMVIWAHMLEQIAATWALAFEVFRQTPEVQVSDLGKGFLTGLGAGSMVTTTKNPAADRWMKKLDDFNGRMYDYEVIIKGLYAGTIPSIPHDDSFTHSRAFEHHRQKREDTDLRQMLLDIVVRPILIGTTASLGQAASTYYPNQMPYSKVDLWADVATPMNLLVELQGVSEVGKKIAESSFPWFTAKAHELMQSGEDLLKDRITAGAVELAAVARVNTQDPAAMKALVDKEFEEYATKAKQKVTSMAMPVAAVGALALLVMMKK